MMRVVAEQEHYLLVSDGDRFTVVERRAGKFYPLCKGDRHGLQLDDATVVQLVREIGLIFRAGWPPPPGQCCFAMAGSVRTHPMRWWWGANRNAHADRLG